MRRLLILGLVCTLPFAAGCSLEPDRPNNVVLMIGDGMGVAPIMQAFIEMGSTPFESFTRGGLVLTHSLSEDTWVTDSAAGATAFATGHKTVNRLLSLRPKAGGGFDTLRTVVDAAQDAGMSTGLVVTCQITHATPAAFYAHAERSRELDIAAQFLDSGIDLAFGGGTSFFLPVGEKGGKREDGRNLLKELEDRGYRVVLDTLAFRELEPPVYEKIVGLFAPTAMPPPPQRKPTLAEMTRKALEILSENPNGFFLMVEGSQIDWAGHANDADWESREMQDFAAAVQAALEFARNDGKTLVVVTADHETGGMAVTGGSQADRTAEVGYLVTHHTANPVPLFLYGPGSDRFPALVDNTFIGQKLLEFVSGQ